MRPVALSSLTGGQDGDETGPVLTEERRPVVLYPALALLTAVVTPVSPRNLTDPVRAGALRAESEEEGVLGGVQPGDDQLVLPQPGHAGDEDWLGAGGGRGTGQAPGLVVRQTGYPGHHPGRTLLLSLAVVEVEVGQAGVARGEPQ